MPSWSEILAELQQGQENTGVVDFDGVRRRFLRELHAHTGRSVVLYSTDYLGKGAQFQLGQQTSINLGDMQGLMEVFKDLPGPNLDLILHSPGGQAEATERLVRYMRSKFTHVRIFIPLAAMSAATMWTMAADEIVMGKHSQVGPIDPQVSIPGGLTVPAGALLDQFKGISDEVAKDPTRITAWLPTLQQYPPGLLNVCANAAKLAQDLVAEWLETYVLGTTPAATGSARTKHRKASKSAAAWLASHKSHLSHSRSITREQLRQHGIPVTDLEDDQTLQDLALSVHHATLHTFQSPAVKLIENHLGKAFVQQVHVRVQQAQLPAQMPIPQQPVPQPQLPQPQV